MSIEDAVPVDDSVVEASHRYFVDSTEADQGVATATGDRTIKDHVDAIGATKKATMYFRHDFNADTTTYTVTTSETVPSNITLEIENGAIFAGAGTLTVKGDAHVGIGQVYNAAGVIAYSGSNGFLGNIGAGTATPACIIDAAGTIRATAQTIPTSGYGMELLMQNAFAGLLIAYNRTTSGYLALNIDGDPLILNKFSGGNVGIGVTTPLYELQIAGTISLLEKSADPTEPAEGECVIWMSDGTGKGDDGDVLIASQAGGTTKYGTLFDHSGGAGW